MKRFPPKEKQREKGRYVRKYEQPLSKKIYSLRLPLEVSEKVEELGEQKGEWLRQVIVEASENL